MSIIAGGVTNFYSPEVAGEAVSKAQTKYLSNGNTKIDGQ